MDQQQLQAYVERIGLDEVPPCSIEGLEQMQRAHLNAVPFENLDILNGNVPLDVSEEGLFDKIVNRGRGGICYELNFLYAKALEAMGFMARLVGARIYDNGNEADHVFVMVEDPDSCDRFITDVGFAYNFAAPLMFEPEDVQDDGRCRYRIDEHEIEGEQWFHLVRIEDGEESFMFAFRDYYRLEEEFDERRHFFESNPSSRFRKGPLVCIDGDEGRITLSMHRLVETRDGMRKEREIDYPDEFDELLSSVFKMRA